MAVDQRDLDSIGESFDAACGATGRQDRFDFVRLKAKEISELRRYAGNVGTRVENGRANSRSPIARGGGHVAWWWSQFDVDNTAAIADLTVEGQHRGS